MNEEVTQTQPEVAVRVQGPHTLTVAAMTISGTTPTPEEVAAIQQAIRQAEALAMADEQAAHEKIEENLYPHYVPPCPSPRQRPLRQ